MSEHIVSDVNALPPIAKLMDFATLSKIAGLDNRHIGLAGLDAQYTFKIAHWLAPMQSKNRTNKELLMISTREREI